MRKLFIALAAASALAACDPTEKHDYSCYAEQESETACIQLHITEIEGNVASAYCERSTSADPAGLGGDWDYNPCDAEHATYGTRTAGYCAVDDIGGYRARVFFYEMEEGMAQSVCEMGGYGEWVSEGQ